jgi:hypothetical protein
MQLRSFAFALSTSAIVFGCAAPVDSSAPNEESATATSEEALGACPAGQTRVCDSDTGEKPKTICYCEGAPPGKPAWSGESVALIEYPNAFGGFAAISGHGWRPFDTVDVYLHMGCGQVTRQVQISSVGGDGSFSGLTTDIWRLCSSSHAYFEIVSRTTTATMTQITWMYDTR